MILHVNLIGAQKRKDAAYWQTVMVCFIAILAVLGAAVWFAFPGMKQKKTLEAEIASEKKVIGDNKPRADQVTKVKDQAKDLTPASEMIRETRQASIDWLRVMAILDGKTPDTVWVDQVISEFDKTEWRHTIRIRGRAIQQSDVADYIHRIAGTAPFNEMKMDFQTQKSKEQLNEPGKEGQGNQVDIVEFTILAPLRYVIGEYVQ